MQDMLNNLFNPSSQLAYVIVTLIILVAGIFIAKVVAKLSGSALRKTGINEKLNRGNNKIDFTKSFSKIIYYVLVLNVILIVLERLGITSVLDPLKELVAQFLNALPRLIGAGIIFYAGWIIAQLCSSFVEVMAIKIDDYIEKKNLSPEFKISKFLSAFVFGGVLIPIVIAGLDFMAIKAISVPAIKMINEFMLSVPNIVGAGLILLVSYMIGKFIVFLLVGLLDGMNINEVPSKMGFDSLLPKETGFSNFVGKVVMFFIMVTATTAAVEKLDISIVSNVFSKLINFAGGVLLGGVILLLGNFLANIAYKKLNSSQESSQLAGIARFAILGLVLAMGIKAMGFADEIVNMAFGLTLGSIAISFAIAFGVGGIEAAKDITKKLSNKLK